MRRVLIVDDSELLVQHIANACFSGDEVCSCGDGNTALDMLSAFCPDLLLLNMTLPYKDGLAVLREAAFLPKTILAISYMTDPHVVRMLGALGVQYVLHMPTARGIDQALQYLQQVSPAVRTDLRSSVIEHLHRLRIPTNLDGYRMLAVGLPLFLGDIGQQLGKELYPAIACAMGYGTEQTVERSIRQAIKTGWKCRDDHVWGQYFPPNTRGVISCPSNKKFLMTLAQRLQEE